MYPAWGPLPNWAWRSTVVAVAVVAVPPSRRRAGQRIRSARGLLFVRVSRGNGDEGRPRRPASRQPSPTKRAILFCERDRLNPPPDLYRIAASRRRCSDIEALAGMRRANVRGATSAPTAAERRHRRAAQSEPSRRSMTRRPGSRSRPVSSADASSKRRPPLWEMPGPASTKGTGSPTCVLMSMGVG